MPLGNPLTIRRRLDIRGRVQGVGFRPFVYRLALEEGLAGMVGNDTRGVYIEVEGVPEAVDRFTARLRDELPPLARIASLETRETPPRHERAFRIERSLAAGRQEAEITPDIATCEDCLRELVDPADRRYRYPFINCTNCGPRYSIVLAVPYDRPNTTMARFRMCPACQAEYDDPANRRFHAQPNACPVCGPRLWMTNPGGELLEGDPVRLCAAMLREGRIVAIKGLGGFHLACRADDDEVVARLRERKSREAKPFAVMAGSPEMARRLILLEDPLEEAARKCREETTAATQPAPEQILSPIETVLLDRARPIVLAPKRPGARVSGHVAPNSACFGIMLPYTPLHHLLFAEGLGPLVMTSGNPAEEPLSCANDEALRRLSHIADAFLLHDRDIARRVDDSVVLAVSFWSAQAMLAPCSPPAMLASSPPGMLASSPPAMLAPCSPPAMLASSPPGMLASSPPAMLAPCSPPAMLASSPPAMLAPCSPPAMLASSPPAMLAPCSPPAMLMAESEYRGLSPESQRLEHGSSTPKSVAILPIRRARGFVPEPVKVPNEAGRPVLAVGGELKSAICLLRGRNAVVSEHLGELSNPAAFRNFVGTIAQFKKLLKIEPEIVACDLHPDYAATRYARGLCAAKKPEGGALLLVRVQHHHAHVVSCMAENGVTGRVIGVACDGTGYGTDGQIWGCEILVCDEGEFERAGHLCYYPLPGGDAAARDTWRPAVSLLLETFGPEWKSAAAHILKRGDSQALELAAARLLAWKARQESGASGAGLAAGKGVRVQASAWPLTSSLGRLFDAAAFLLGVCGRNRYEAEAAMSLEAQAGCCESAEALPFAIIDAGSGTPGSEEALQLDFRPLVRALVEQAGRGRPVPEIARAFHETLVAMLAEAVDRTSRATGLKRVALSGGCFANQILLQGLWQRLAASGHEVFVHRAMPAGDGGIALGQAVVGASKTESAEC